MKKRHKARLHAQDPFWNLVATAKQLNGPGGCSWDRAQTVQSLLPHLVEEAWEAFCAARGRNRQHFEEELGDVLYTVVFLSVLAQREGWFDLKTLLRHVNQKMVRRHPHVFGNKQADSALTAYAHWQAAKRLERRWKAPSNSQRMRPLLVALFDALRVKRHAPRVFEKTLKNLARIRRRANGSPRRPNAT